MGDVMQITQALVEKVEQKGALSIKELERLVCSSIPESCDDCGYAMKTGFLVLLGVMLPAGYTSTKFLII